MRFQYQILEGTPIKVAPDDERTDFTERPCKRSVTFSAAEIRTLYINGSGTVSMLFARDGFVMSVEANDVDILERKAHD